MQLQEQKGRDVLESERLREQREKYAKESADAERVLRDLENKLDQEQRRMTAFLKAALEQLWPFLLGGESGDFWCG